MCARAHQSIAVRQATHTHSLSEHTTVSFARTPIGLLTFGPFAEQKKIQNANVPIAVSHLLGLTISNSVVSHSANIPRTFSLACMLCMYKENYICRSAMMSVLYRRVLFAVRATVHRVCLCVCVCAGEKETMRR